MDYMNGATMVLKVVLKNDAKSSNISFIDKRNMIMSVKCR